MGLARVVGLDHVQPAMPAGEESQARAFYSEVLGLTEEPKPADLAKRVACGSVESTCRILLATALICVSRYEVAFSVETKGRRRSHPRILDWRRVKAVALFSQALSELARDAQERAEAEERAIDSVLNDPALPELRQRRAVAGALRAGRSENGSSVSRRLALMFPIVRGRRRRDHQD